VRVVAALIYDERGRVLVTQRPAGKSRAGQWEFPGGKIEGGESGAEALRRELREELGVQVTAAHALLELAHEYPEQQVLLSAWVVDAMRGVPCGREGQRLRWALPAALRALPLLPADLPIVAWLENTQQAH
jgi:8-oxo-dGTP diphosphatase